MSKLYLEVCGAHSSGGIVAGQGAVCMILESAVTPYFPRQKYFTICLHAINVVHVVTGEQKETGANSLLPYHSGLCRMSKTLCSLMLLSFDWLMSQKERVGGECGGE